LTGDPKYRPRGSSPLVTVSPGCDYEVRERNDHRWSLAIAARLSEAIQDLCYATEMTSPADVSEVLGALETMGEQVPVIAAQLVAWLDDEAESDRLLAPDGPFVGDVPAAVATAAHWLHQTAELGDQMRLALANTRVAVRLLAGSDVEQASAPM
jgi:hypothetical protein